VYVWTTLRPTGRAIATSPRFIKIEVWKEWVDARESQLAVQRGGVKAAKIAGGVTATALGLGIISNIFDGKSAQDANISLAENAFNEGTPEGGAAGGAAGGLAGFADTLETQVSGAQRIGNLFGFRIPGIQTAALDGAASGQITPPSAIPQLGPKPAGGVIAAVSVAFVGMFIWILAKG